MASNQDSSLGFAPEATFGTFVAPTRHIEFVDDGLDLNKEIKQGEGLRVGSRVARSARRVVVAKDAGGPIKFEAVSKGLGLILQWLIGAGTSTLVSGTTYQQVFTFADIMPSGSWQRGLPRADGTIACHSLPGSMAKSFEIAFPTKDLLTISADVDARNFDTAQTYTSPTYAASQTPFSFAGSSFTTGALTAPTAIALASSPTSIGNIRGGSIKVDHHLTTDRFNGGGGGLKSRQMPGIHEITGKFTVEHENTTDWVSIAANETPLNWIGTWVTPVALSTGVETLQVVVPELKVSGMPKSNGGDLITYDIDVAGLDNLTASQPFWVILRTSDSAL
jgi:hypothetical protein